MSPSLYRRLDPSLQQIRLIELLPSPEAGTIRCSLLTASLKDTTLTYHALSYCWGTPLNPETVSINGHLLTVTPNLAAALRHFRDTVPSLPAPIWIDAICIDQKNVLERNAQVAMMSEIYHRAAKIHIWLGIMDGAGPETKEVLQEFAWQDISLKPMPWVTAYNEESLKKFETLRPITENPYWKRIWIIQEVSLAEHIDVRFNDQCLVLYEAPHKCPLNNFYSNADSCVRAEMPSGPVTFQSRAAMERIRQHASALVADFEQIAMAKWMYSAAFLIAEGQVAWKRIPQTLFLRLRHSLATDPRDKIFGTMSLFHGTLFAGMRPDYTRTMQEVSRDATLALIEFSQDLEVLCQACSNCESLPSWVPDFRVPSRMPEHLAQQWRGNEADRGVKMTCRMNEKGRLVLRGFEMDEVRCIARGIADELIDAGPQHAACSRVLLGWRACFDEYYKPWDAANDSMATRRLVFWTAVCSGYIEPEPFTEDLSNTCEGVLKALIQADVAGFSRDESKAFLHLWKSICVTDFFMTVQGHAGSVPHNSVKDGDCILILGGCPVPFCARRTILDGDEVFSLGGPCFVECRMDSDTDNRRQGKVWLHKGPEGSLGIALEKIDAELEVEAMFREIEFV